MTCRPGKAIRMKKKNQGGMSMVGLMQFPLYYIFLFCRFMEQARG